jgi:hypothetical protein
MKITLIGSQGVGKHLFMKDFLRNYPTFGYPEKTFRDIPGIKLNQNGDKESQLLILNSLIEGLDMVPSNYDVIYNRCVLDNILYSVWLYDKKKGGVDEDFIDKCRTICLEAVTQFDLIIHLPVTPELELTNKDNPLRDTDLVFQNEMECLYSALIKSYYKEKRIFLPKEDCPFLLSIEGPVNSRVSQLKNYLNAEGHFIQPDTSFLNEL